MTRQLGPMRDAGSKVRGGQTCLRTTVSVCVRRWWFENVEQVWATSSGPYGSCCLLWGGELLQTKEKLMLRNAFLLYGQYHAGAILERTFTLSLYFVGLSYATKAFSPHHHSQCSSTGSVSSIRVTPRMFGVHSICTQNMISLSCSRLR